MIPMSFLEEKMKCWIFLGAAFVLSEPLNASALDRMEAKSRVDSQSDFKFSSSGGSNAQGRGSLGEQPGVIATFTDEDIAHLGARDLLDIFQMVPGLQIAADVQGVVSLGMRGIWAQEGRILVLWDGHEMNELDFASNNFGNHFPVDQIKEISILSGPGTVVYGGFAELAVVNIVTKKFDDLKGVTASFKYGQMDQALGRADLSFQGGKQIGDAKISLSGFVGRGNRSDRNYKDLYGGTFNMAGRSALNPSLVNLDFQWKDLNVGFLWDHFVTTYQDGYSISYPYPIGMNFDSWHAQVKYDFWLDQHRLRISPKLKIEQYQGWSATGDDAKTVQNMTDTSPARNSIYGVTGVEYGTTTTRTRLAADLQWDPDQHLEFTLGFTVNSIVSQDPYFPFVSNGAHQLSYLGSSLYGQGVWRHSLANLTVGARYETTGLTPAVWVPMIALTKALDAFRVKLLGSKTYRSPTVQNIDSNSAIQSEVATTFELEIGYQLGKNFNVSANVFDLTIKDPIFYSYTNHSYLNGTQTGSRGFGVDLRYLGENFSSTLSYSFYDAAGKNQVENYAVPSRGDQVLALAPHKLTWNNRIQLSQNVSLNPQLVYLGSRFGYEYGGVPSSPFQNILTAAQSAQLMQFGPTLLLNAYLRYQDFFVKNMNAGLGIFNLLDQNYRYLEANYFPGNSHPALPAGSREIVVDVSYRHAI